MDQVEWDEFGGAGLIRWSGMNLVERDGLAGVG